MNISDVIPEEMQRLEQWVAWRSVSRNGRPANPPIVPHTERFARVNDRATWSTLEHAIATAMCIGGGIGFVFTEDDDFWGVDLDGCRNPETGTIDDWASDILSGFDSEYIEVSPTGTGVHIIGTGTPPYVKDTSPAGERYGKRCGVEQYDAGRYFTLTGNQIKNAVAAQ